MTLQHITSIFRSPSFWDEHPTEPYQKCGGKISSAWRSPGWGPRWMMWCLDHLGISQVIQFEVLPERSILEICVTHMLLIDSFSRKHGIDLCIWEIATDVFGKIIWDHTFCSGDAKDDSSVCLKHHVNNFATAMQLEQRLKEPATSFDLLWVTNKKHNQQHFSTYEAKSLIYVWCLKIPCISSSSLFSVQSFPILIIVSGVLLPELHGAQTSRSATRSWIQLGCEHFWPLEMASWEWNMSQSCWSFKSWRMGMDAYYLTLLLILVGMSRLEWGGAGSFVDMICGNILFEAHGPRL